VGISIQYPDYHVKLSGIKFSMNFEYSLVQSDVESSIDGSATFSVEDMSVKYSNSEFNSSAVSFGEYKVDITSGDDIYIDDLALSDIMKEFLVT
jgi:hypothetical protein